MSLRELLSGIAEAIREQEGSAESIAALDFPERIRALKQGGGIALQALRIVTGPTKTAYYYSAFASDAFDPAGMTFQAAAGDESRSYSFPVPLADIVFSPSGPLARDASEITATLYIGGQAASVVQSITMRRRATDWAELETACPTWTALEASLPTWAALETPDAA